MRYVEESCNVNLYAWEVENFKARSVPNMSTLVQHLNSECANGTCQIQNVAFYC